LDQLESKKQYMRNYMAEYREKQKALTAGKPNCKTNSKTNVSQAEEDKEEEREKELDNKKESISCQQIVDLYHSICISFPKVRSLSDARRKAIKARLNTYTLEDFQTVFENAEASSFLKGSNDRNWTATFDWLIKDSNMAKVLEGNYADKQPRYTRRETKPNWMQPSLEMGEAELDAIKRMMGTVTVEENTAVAQEAEAMQQRMREKYGRKEA
jgi:hypothetical protein